MDRCGVGALQSYGDLKARMLTDRADEAGPSSGHIDRVVTCHVERRDCTAIPQAKSRAIAA